MDWTTAIITALGSLDIIAVIQLIRYRHENKTLKENEVGNIVEYLDGDYNEWMKKQGTRDFALGPDKA